MALLSWRPSRSSLFQKIWRGLFLAVVLLPCIAYYCRRDPTSAFFRPEIGYRRTYSAYREQEALAFIKAANAAPQKKASPGSPKLCTGIASVNRKGTRYFLPAVGAVLAGLSEAERSQMHLVLFLAHSDQSQHPAYNESWFRNVADSVLSYPEGELDHVRAMEQAGGKFVEKSLRDYTMLMRACRATNATYTAIIEDDVLAMDGWFHRALDAAAKADQYAKVKGRDDYLYLRLFWTERFFGWNSEEWPYYAFCCFVFVGCEILLLGTLRRRWHDSEHLQPVMIALYLLIVTPLLITLFFAMGRVSLFPFPTRPSIIEMPRFGCCAQAMLFQNSKLDELINYFDSMAYGPADSLMEYYAEKHGELRLALSPSIAQHIGSKSSKEDGTRLETGHHRTFSFQFELNDPKALQLEHQRVLEQRKLS